MANEWLLESDQLLDHEREAHLIVDQVGDLNLLLALELLFSLVDKGAICGVLARRS